jgi:ribonuclease HI
LVYEIKEVSWWLERHGYGVHIMWIPSHVGVMGNERADRLAGEAFQGDTEFAAPVRPSDFRPVSRVRMLDS